MKGTFVAPHSLEKERNIEICFAFPEKQFTPDTLGEENYRICFEYQRGILDAISDKNASLQMIYFKDDVSPEVLKRQVQKLSGFDIVVFPSCQLENLAIAVSEKVLTFQLIGDSIHKVDYKNVHSVNIDDEYLYQKMAEHMADCGCKTAGIIGSFHQTQGNKKIKLSREERKITLLKEYSNKQGIKILQKYIRDPENLDSFIKLFEKGDFPDVFCCINPRQIELIYEAAYRTGVIIGKDFQLIATDSVSDAGRYHPLLTYFYFPRYEIGRRVIEIAIDSLCSKKPVGSIPMFLPFFVQGETTQIKELALS